MVVVVLMKGIHGSMEVVPQMEADIKEMKETVKKLKSRLLRSNEVGNGQGLSDRGGDDTTIVFRVHGKDYCRRQIKIGDFNGVLKLWKNKGIQGMGVDQIQVAGVDEFTMLVGGSDAAGSLENELAELGYTYRDHLFAAIDPIPAIAFPPIKRLELLLTVKESALNVPTNLEARRRIAFFTNSLFMEMPRAPPVRKMWSFSVMTPYYSEETVYSKSDLELENEDGVSIIFYLQKIFPDEWNNFIIHTTTHFSDLKMKRSGSMWLWRCSFMIYGEEDKSAM
ncbi:hypothetical protein C5167_002874 [Papaver somniferum]|uniref:Glycosyl transferase 48 domain-containing protein n=1 Tax=Papaver somniferum TaxID=3469 RepID=A0A4Y7L1Z4_PAPSO|nr:hypothetical protein C5167_002874 [Papaver somniferum]